MAAPMTDSEAKYIFLRAVGGEAPGSTLAQKVGPLGVSAKVVGEDIKKMTMKYKGMKVGIMLAIKDRKAEIEVVLSTANFVIEALREAPRDRKKVKNIKHDGNITMTDLIQISRKVASRAKAKSFKGVVTQVLGTCQSVGCTVDQKSPKQLTQEINDNIVVLPTE